MKNPLSNYLILATIIIMDLLSGMEFDLFVPSFPALQNQFSLSPFSVEALLSANFIGYCISLFFIGSLSDRYGRKPILLVGLSTFVIGSVLCVWEPTYLALLIGRFFQGIGIAAPSILSFLIIADTYPIKKQQYFLALLNGVMNISVGMAPIAGSYITLYFNWQGNFIALLLLGCITLLMVLLWIPPTAHKHQKQEPLSSRGYTQLWESKPLRLLIIYIVLMILPYWIFVGMTPILYMQDLGVSLSHFGYYQGILALIFALGCFIFGWMLSRQQLQDQNKLLVFSRKISILSLILMIGITYIDSHNPLLITLVFIPFVLGQIIPSTILYPVCLDCIPEAKGQISAVIQGMRLIFSAIFLQISGYYYQGSFQNIGIILVVCIALMLVAMRKVEAQQKSRQPDLLS